MPRTRLISTVLAVGALLVVGACGSAADIAGESTLVPALDLPTVSDEPQGSLDEFTRRIWGSAANETQNDMQARIEWEHRFREELITACMAEHGFTYLPDLSNPPQAVFPEGPSFRTREFAQINGFGLSNQMMMAGNIRTQHFGNRKNDEALFAMSQAERAEWQRALHGNVVEIDFYGLEAERDIGCSGSAWERLSSADVEEFAAIRAEVERFNQSIFHGSFPALVDLNHEWANCMASLGYPGQQSPAIMLQNMMDEWRAISDNNNIIASWDWETYPDGPLGFYVAEDGEWRVEAPADGAEADFAEREILLAVAEIDCREQIDFETRRTDIEHRLQSEFVDQHRNELEAWAAYAEARRGLR